MQSFILIICELVLVSLYDDFINLMKNGKLMVLPGLCCRTSGADAPVCLSRNFTARHGDLGYMTLAIDSAPKKGSATRMLLRVVIKQAWTSPASLKLADAEVVPVTSQWYKPIDLSPTDAYDLPASAFLTTAPTFTVSTSKRRLSSTLAFSKRQSSTEEPILPVEEEQPKTFLEPSLIFKTESSGGEGNANIDENGNENENDDENGSDRGDDPEAKSRSQEDIGDEGGASEAADSVGSGVRDSFLLQSWHLYSYLRNYKCKLFGRHAALHLVSCCIMFKRSLMHESLCYLPFITSHACIGKLIVAWRREKNLLSLYSSDLTKGKYYEFSRMYIDYKGFSSVA